MIKTKILHIREQWTVTGTVYLWFQADFGEGTGYSTLMVFNVFFAVGPFTAPFAVRILREKASLVLAGASYVLYVSVFFHPSFLTLHVASAAVGKFTLAVGCDYQKVIKDCGYLLLSGLAQKYHLSK